jgi:predicted CoA-binding protein
VPIIDEIEAERQENTILIAQRKIIWHQTEVENREGAAAIVQQQMMINAANRPVFTNCTGATTA